MKVAIRLFGGIAARARTGHVEVDLPDDATAASILPAVAAHVPDVDGLLRSAKVAVNLEIANEDRPLRPGDEVAVLPPVAGGSDARLRDVAITTGLRDRPLDVDEALAAVAAPSAGATTIFLGTVRDHADGLGPVERLAYSAYAEMAETTLRTIAEEIAGRHTEIIGLAILHAVGDLAVGTPTIVVACSAPHREEAFSACRDALEEVKARVPVWKREVGPDGSRWVGLDGC